MQRNELKYFLRSYRIDIMKYLTMLTIFISFSVFSRSPAVNPGFKSNTLKYTLNKIGKTKFLVIFYFSEGRVFYLDKSSQVRTYLLTINGTVEEKNLFFQRGPILMEEFVSKRHDHLSRSSLELIDLDKNGIKDIVIESSSGRKSIYVLSNKVFWERL